MTSRRQRYVKGKVMRSIGCASVQDSFIDPDAAIALRDAIDSLQDVMTSTQGALSKITDAGKRRAVQDAQVDVSQAIRKLKSVMMPR